jgi:small subunit ribosomal protein S2
MEKDLLISPEEFLKAGLHIGTKYKTKGMVKYIYKTRKDGLKVLAIETISKKLAKLAKILAKYESPKVAIVGRRIFASKPINKFCEITGMKPFIGRFIPGTFTNKSAKLFFEPDMVLIAESNIDKQAITEAKQLNIPVVSFSSTNNFTENIDFVVPANNKGRKSLAMLFWLLARQIQLEQGIIKTKIDFKHTVESFEFKGKTRNTGKKNFRGGPPGRGRRPSFNSRPR